MRVGFIGIGSQGGPMAAAIARSEHDLVVWARRPEAVPPVFGDAPHEIAPSVAELAAAVEVACVCVLADDDVEQVCLADDGLVPNLGEGSVLLVHSTVHPATVQRVADAAAARGVAVLDAPVTGGAPAASSGTLLTMVGGDPDVLERVRPVLAAHSNRIVHLGPIGAGQSAKVINNTVLTAQLVLADRAITAGEQLGLAHDPLVQVLTGGSARSFALDLMGPPPDRKAMSVGFRGLLEKDTGILERVAGDLPAAAELVRVAKQLWA